MCFRDFGTDKTKLPGNIASILGDLHCLTMRHRASFPRTKAALETIGGSNSKLARHIMETEYYEERAAEISALETLQQKIELFEAELNQLHANYASDSVADFQDYCSATRHQAVVAFADVRTQLAGIKAGADEEFLRDNESKVADIEAAIGQAYAKVDFERDRC